MVLNACQGGGGDCCGGNGDGAGNYPSFIPLADKYGEEGGDGGRIGGPLGIARMESAQSVNPEMLLPQALPLRNPAASSSSLHKRLYPRFYQAYVSKVSDMYFYYLSFCF